MVCFEYKATVPCGVYTHSVMDVGKVMVSPFWASAGVANGVATMLHAP